MELNILFDYYLNYYLLFIIVKIRYFIMKFNFGGNLFYFFRKIMNKYMYIEC